MTKRKQRRAAGALDRKVSKKLRDFAKTLGPQIEEMAGQPMGFALLIFSPVEGERMSYISNCDRAQMHQALKSLIIGWEAGMPDIPAHKVDS